MSRLSRKSIAVPPKVEISKNGDEITVRGPLGELKKSIKGSASFSVENNSLMVSAKLDTQEGRISSGTLVSHLKNMIEGVTNGYKKILIIEGVGYKAKVEGKNLILNIGLSHPVPVEIPEGIKVEMEKEKMTVSGINKEDVGSFTAKIRAMKKPEPYKGKGIRDEKEIIRRKAGKKVAAATAA